MHVNPQNSGVPPVSARDAHRRFLREPSPVDLRDAVRPRPEDHPLKAGPRGSVSRVQRDGASWVVKRFAGGWKDRFRPTRARRAWAACNMLRALDLPTVVPVGYVESPAENCFVYEHLDDAVTAREWIKPRMHREPEYVRHQVADELLALLLDLYARGVYHGDTKAGNLLVRHRDDPARRRYAWIDLESVVPLPRPGEPGRARIERNLVQLNGAIGRRIPREDRARFLARLAETHAWAAEPGVIEALERETERRLRRELRRECGP